MFISKRYSNLFLQILTRRSMKMTNTIFCQDQILLHADAEALAYAPGGYKVGFYKIEPLIILNYGRQVNNYMCYKFLSQMTICFLLS